MIQKKIGKPTISSRFRTGVKIVIFAEIIGFVCSYGTWKRMNTDQEFRRYMNEKFPYALEGFYKVGELFDKEASARLRQTDLAVFESKKSK